MPQTERTTQRVIESDLFPYNRVSYAAKDTRNAALVRSILHGRVIVPSLLIRVALLGALLPSSQELSDSDHGLLEKVARNYVGSTASGCKGSSEALAMLTAFAADDGAIDNFLYLSDIRRILVALNGKQPVVVTDVFDAGGAAVEALRFGARTICVDQDPISRLAAQLRVRDAAEHGRALARELILRGEIVRRRAEKVLRKYFPALSNTARPYATILTRTMECPHCKTLLHLAKGPLTFRIQGRERVVRAIHKDGSTRWVVETPKSPRLNTPHSGEWRANNTWQDFCWSCGQHISWKDIERALAIHKGANNRVAIVAVVGEIGGKLDIREANAHDDVGRQLAESHSEKYSPLPWFDGYHDFGELFSLNMKDWGSLFSKRQKAVVSTFTRLIEAAIADIAQNGEPDFVHALGRAMTIALAIMACYHTTLTTHGIYGPMPLTWPYRATVYPTFAEIDPLVKGQPGTWDHSLHEVTQAILDVCASATPAGLVEKSLSAIDNGVADVVVADHYALDLVISRLRSPVQFPFIQHLLELIGEKERGGRSFLGMREKLMEYRRILVDGGTLLLLFPGSDADLERVEKTASELFSVTKHWSFRIGKLQGADGIGSEWHIVVARK